MYLEFGTEEIKAVQVMNKRPEKGRRSVDTELGNRGLYRHSILVMRSATNTES